MRVVSLRERDHGDIGRRLISHNAGGKISDGLPREHLTEERGNRFVYICVGI
jgi:hypothetical protein